MRLAGFGTDGYENWLDRPGSDAATQLRERLGEYRREGRTFWQAWPLALSRVRFISQREQALWLNCWRDPEILGAWAMGYDRARDIGAESVGRLEGLAEEVGASERVPEDPYLYALTPRDGFTRTDPGGGSPWHEGRAVR
jgi:hypothetical protein